MRRRPIGQILVEKGEISEVDLETALAEQERSGRRLGEILIEQGRTSWLAISRAIAEQLLDFQKAEPEPACLDGARRLQKCRTCGIIFVGEFLSVLKGEMTDPEGSSLIPC